MKKIFKYPIFFDILITAMVAFLFRQFIIRQHLKDATPEILIEILVFIMVFIVLQLLRLYHHKKFLFHLDDIEGHSTRPIFEHFASKIMAQLRDMISSALSSEGIQLKLLDVDLICQLCFKFGDGIYNGVDSNQPSEFIKKYPQYLNYQEDNAKKRQGRGIRILCVGGKTLENDFSNNKSVFLHFKHFHDKNSIDLFQVDPSVAIEYAQNCGIKITDIGIWDNEYAMLFCPVADPTSLRLHIVTSNSDETLFGSCKNYLMTLLEYSNVIRISGSDKLTFEKIERNKIENYKKQLRDQWR